MARHSRPVRRGPRIRAVLAGGLVLVGGATVTLATWTDNEYARASFTAGTFDIVGSRDGSTFVNTTAANPAALTLTTGAGSLIPGQTVYTGYAVKTGPNSVPASITLPAPTVTGDRTDVFRVEIKTLSSFACNATSFAASANSVLPSSPLTTGPSGSLNLAAAGGDVINFCFAITLPVTANNSYQGASATVTWAFQGTSRVP